MRRLDKKYVSPILRDLSRGTGGLGSGLFTMSNTDNLPLDATDGILGTEDGTPVATQLGTPVATS